MKVAIYGKSFSKEFIPSIKLILKKIKEHASKIWIEKSYFNFISSAIKSTPNIEGTFSNYQEIDNSFQFIFSIGGDGTFLNTIPYVRDKKIPIIGINSGRLGFLANISQQDIENAIDSIFKKKYCTEKRSLIELDSGELNLFSDFNFALNEVTIHKRDSASMIKIHTFVNDVFLNTYWADGLIIATPTGSTAYSLSVGGPIVMPDSESFIITPIAPHNLTVRPLIVSDKNEITLKVEGRCNKFLTSLDHRSETFPKGSVLKVRKANFNIEMLRLKNHHFFSTLRNKLMWGADKRN